MKARNNISIMEPNIYDFAHTEYAQDAFVAWVCSNFHSQNKSRKSIAEKFMNDLLGIDVEISQVKASTQVKKIDVLLTLNGGEYYVIIEDKKHSDYHNNQLLKYIDELKGVKHDQIFVVYYKTGHISKTPNFIYSKSSSTFKYDMRRKSEYGLVNGIKEGKYSDLRKTKVCDLKEINDFFEKNAGEIADIGSEILDNYAYSIRSQYDSYMSDSVPAKEQAKAAIWGRAFDEFISKAQLSYPELAFKLDRYSGFYWEIYVVSKKKWKNDGEYSFEDPILNVRGDIFQTNPPKVYFFNSNKLFKKTDSVKINAKSVTCKLDLCQSAAKYDKEYVEIQDLYELLDAVCKEFINFLSNSEEVPFNCKLF